MEEEKAAAYYEELTRKGQGASRFKQGLGFSSSSNDTVSAPSRGSALASNSSFLNTFVKASSPTKASEYEKHARIESIQNKLRRKKQDEKVENGRERSRDRVSRGREYKSRSRSRSRERYRDRGRERRRSRSRSRSRERYRDRDRERERDRRRRRSRSLSPRETRRRSEKGKERNSGVDFSKFIEGYERMTPAEKVKARMKFQLDETAGKDKTKGIGWERFEFNKDAPLDDEEMEAAEDDAPLVKHIGQSFRFSALEARREEQIKAAHDEAMFGVSTLPICTSPRGELEADNEKESNDADAITSLLSDKVLAKPQGSWRDRVRKE